MSSSADTDTIFGLPCKST